MLWPAHPFRHAPAINRRAFLLTTGSLAAATLWAPRAEGVVLQEAKFPSYPFPLGVASGDPAADGFVIWTRLAPKPLEGGGMPREAVNVEWQVAEDDKLTKVVQKGTSVASPDWGHSIHVEVAGLQPDRWYWYQFKAGNEVSPVGRARTFPAAASNPAKLRFAFASCQHYEQGLYTAYEHMVKEELDVIVHLGDYIYEGSPQKRIREHNSREIQTLDEYRNRHALYRLDPALQNAHRLFPWLVTWDDHEFDNNCAGAISEEKNVQPEDFLKRRAAAYQAYYEHMPLRRSAVPQGPDMLLYRKVPFGQLAEFFVLDTRQYRTDQPCGDGNKPPCDGMLDPNGTLLGPQQEKWLIDGLAASRGKWNVLAQQVMMARVDQARGDAQSFSMDQWPGYEMNRRRLLKAFHERKISNPVVLTGDIHNNWANNLIADFDNLDSRIVATEFVGTSISSGGDGTKTPRALDQLLSENPFVKFHNAERGYVSCEVTPARWKTNFQVVEYVTKPGAPLVTRASYVVEDGNPGAQQA